MRNLGRRGRTIGIAGMALAACAVGSCGAPTGPKYADVAVVYDQDSSIVRSGAISLAQASRGFYQLYPDQYEFLVIFTVADYSVFEIPSTDLAHYLTVRNHVGGIGLDQNYDIGRQFGSPGKLEGIVYLGALDRYCDIAARTVRPGTSFIVAHEFGHRFGAYASILAPGAPRTHLLDFYRSHWTLAMSSGASPMGGMDWRDDGDGTFTAMDKWRGLYSWLDLYLMGLAQPDEVGPITVLDIDPRPDSVAIGTTLATTARTFTADEVIAATGTRVPACGEAPTSWRAAFILVASNSQEADAAAVAALDAVRTWWSARFRELTRDRGTMITDLAP